MKFKMIIDKSKDEEIVATVHAPSELTEKIRQLVMEHTGTDRIAAYWEDDIKMLAFSQIACITVCDGKTYAVDVKGTQYRLKQRYKGLLFLVPYWVIHLQLDHLHNIFLEHIHSRHLQTD